MEESIINNRKGFTLAELLIAAAIISVLVGVSIPIFNNQLEKSREATDLANIRAAYAVAAVEMITNPDEDCYVEVVYRHPLGGRDNGLLCFAKTLQ
ncbi:MAG: prepilin-type N-terminal cleavage/methylation domain-containing protein [Bulleidia sp.]|nr:prepilin-type N-terminal cleavage/methylation domain-containing protein [Bulleidia sp.]